MARLSGFQWTHTGQVQQKFRRAHITLCLQFSIFFFSAPFLYICHSHTLFCFAIYEEFMSLPYAIFFLSALLFIFANLTRSVSSISYIFLQRSFSCHLPFSHRRPGDYICHSHTGGRLYMPFSHRRAMDINVFGLIRGIQTVLPLIRFSL